MIKNLQILRAFAAISVVFFHSDKFLLKEHLQPFGAAGVDIFFVISGFIMTYNTQITPTNPRAFLINRFVRILPMYWLMTIGVYLIALTFPHLLNSTQPDPIQLVKSLFFIPFQKSNGLVEPILFVGWSLNYEIFFYLLFSISLILPSMSRSGILMIVLTTLVAAGLLAPNHNILWSFYTSPIILEFAIGMLTALLIPRAPAEVGATTKIITASGLLCAPLLLFFPLIWPHSQAWIAPMCLSGGLVTSVILLDRWGWSWNSAGLLLAGDASYVLYLSHPYVTQVLQKFALWLPGFVGLALALAAALFVALQLHMQLERPITRYLKRRLANLGGVKA